MPDRGTRKTQITARRQEQIIKAALDVFTHKGYAAATIPEIARQAGIATGTIYLYYPSKRELFMAVIKNTIITPPLLKIIGNITSGDVSNTFKQVIKNRLDLINDDTVSRIPLLIGEFVRDEELRKLWLEQFLQPFFSQMEKVYRYMNAAGKFNTMEPAVAVRSIGGLILGFIILKLVEGEDSPLNRIPEEKVADDLAGFILHGLLSENKK
jgi:TetR/AcrR family transcriptional regulator